MTDSLAGARTFRLLLQKPANQKFYDSPNGSPCKKAVNSLRQHTDDASDDQTGHTKHDNRVQVAAGRSGAQAKNQPHPLSRCICAQQQSTGGTRLTPDRRGRHACGDAVKTASERHAAMSLKPSV